MGSWRWLRVPVLPVVVASCGAGEPGLPRIPSEVLNGEYTGILAEPVRLTDGRFEGPPFVPGGASRPEIMLRTDVAARGHLDGDAADELAVVLSESAGGSATLIYLLVLSERPGGWSQVGTVSLGDRVQVLSLSIRDGTLEASLLEHGPDDPSCCPTRPLLRSWRAGDAGLVEVVGSPDEERGR